MKKGTERTVTRHSRALPALHYVGDQARLYTSSSLTMSSSPR